MLTEIALEALRYFDRTALEGLQMHSRYWRDLVDRHARTLPLRRIHRVTSAYTGAFLQLVEGDDGINVEATTEADLETFFHRVNNAFIHELEFGGFCQESHRRLCRFLATANSLQCQIGALRIEVSKEGIDYALIEFLGVHLKPHTYEVSMIGKLREDYVMLFTHEALRGSVRHLVCELYNVIPAPDCIFPELFGVGAIQTCTIMTDVDPRPWIGTFIGMFEAAERGTHVVQTVTLLHQRFGEPTPLPHSFEPLGHPRRTDVPAPHNAFIKKWCQEQDEIGWNPSESTVAELFVFENAKLAKKLEAFVWNLWTVEQGEDMHYVFLLQIVDL